MISIVILNYNGKELLKKYLPSVVSACENYSLEKTELIVVDNASSDGSVDYLRSNFSFIKLINQPVNRGFASSMNRGVSAAQNKIVVSLNNDIEIAQDFLFFLPQHFQDRDVFSVRPGIKMNQEDRGDNLQNPRIGGGFKYGFFDVPKAMQKKSSLAFFSGGGGCTFAKEKFMELGGFDEVFHPFYYEDVDLCYRAWKRGWKVVYEPRSLLYHQGGATVYKIHSPFFINIIAERNRYFLVWKNITEMRLVCQHFFFLPLRLIALLLRGRVASLAGFFYATKSLREILKKRRSEKKFKRVGDLEIFRHFQE